MVPEGEPGEEYSTGVYGIRVGANRLPDHFSAAERGEQSVDEGYWTVLWLTTEDSAASDWDTFYTQIGKYRLKAFALAVFDPFSANPQAALVLSAAESIRFFYFT